MSNKGGFIISDVENEYRARKQISHNEPWEFGDGENFHINIYADTDEKAESIAKKILEVFNDTGK